MEKTFVLLKPDALQRGLVGKVVERFEERGLKLVGVKMLRLDDAILEEHYEHLKDKPFFSGIKNFMKSAPVIATVWEGLEAVEVVREMCGVTNSREAKPGTIRGDYSLSIQCNVVHASDSIETAEKEVNRFFKASELFEWKKTDFETVYSADERGK